MKYVGKEVPTLTSRKLVAGKGTYVGDIYMPGMLYMAIVRSPYAHARIVSINTDAARAVAGVVEVVTGAEIRENTNPIKEGYERSSIAAKSSKTYALAAERVRYVGEGVAAVVAEDRYTARKAADLVEVEYEDLPVAFNAEQAMAPGAPLVEPEWGTNVVLNRQINSGDVARAFAEADGTLKGYLKSHRYMAAPMEPRGYVASYERGTERLTLWASTQTPHPLRVVLSETLGIPEALIRVIQPSVGGAFGNKIPTFPEEPLICYLSKKLERPIKWIEERIENFLTAGHAREQTMHYEVAYKKDGQVTGLKIKVVADVGAPTALVGWEMSLVTTFVLPGTYDVKNCFFDLYTVVTNKCPWNAYRGYGKENASFVMDRIMDRVAKATALDRADVRLRNFIQPDQFPYTNPSGSILDSGDYPKALKRLLELVDYQGFRQMQAEARKQGRYIGIGLGQELVPGGSAFPNSFMVSSYDGATVRVSVSGQVTVLSGVTSPGSGNETGIAQVVADVLGVKLERITVIQGDTDLCPYGLGNYSSRSIAIGASAAAIAAGDIRHKMLTVAGRMLEALLPDMDAEDDRIFVKGRRDPSIGFDEVVKTFWSDPYHFTAIDLEPGLESTRYFKHGNVYHDTRVGGKFNAYPSWPNGAVACIVEVDPETGILKVLRYCMVHDSGLVVNPLLAEGNIHGGVAQGLGGALYEHLVYDENCQLRTATFMDYTIPTAVEMPPMQFIHQETRSPFTPLGTKGVGESGVTGILGAVCSALEDALPHLDLEVSELPLKPANVWRMIKQAHPREARS